MIRQLLPLIVVAAVGTGCSAAFERHVLEERIRRQVPLFNDQDVERIEKIRPQLPDAFTIAVAPPLNWSGDPPSEGERDIVRSWGTDLREAGAIKDFVLIPNMLLHLSQEKHGAGYLKAVRAAAARCHADAVLILGTASDVQGYVNPLSILNATVVGLWVVPGHHREALTLVEGILIDNRNEYLYVTAGAEGSGTVVGPALTIDGADAVRKSRARALEAFGKEFVARVRSLASARGDAPGE